MDNKNKTLYVTNRDEWRSWLEKNHDKEKGIWLIYYKKHTNAPTIPYEDAVEEALCFGWIDSIVKRIDTEKYMQKYTPRKNKSNWSESNKTRVERLMEQGLMTESGLDKIREAKGNGSWHRLESVDKLVLPPDLEKALTSNKRALENFNNFAPSSKRQYIWWVMSAKREVTRKKRIREVTRLAAQNKKPGMK